MVLSYIKVLKFFSTTKVPIHAFRKWSVSRPKTHPRGPARILGRFLNALSNEGSLVSLAILDQKLCCGHCGTEKTQYLNETQYHSVTKT